MSKAPLAVPKLAAPIFAPSAVHRGDDELPWVDAGEGNMVRVLLLAEHQGYFVIENILQSGFEQPAHRHTGPVFGFTVSGS